MKAQYNRALVVSSSPLHGPVLQFNLAKAGFVVTSAASAKEAFHIAEEGQFDLIITDFSTPNGTGVDLARQLRYLGEYDSTPIVLLADKKAELDPESLLDSLWLLVIRGPFNFAELVPKISRHFAPNQASR